MKTGIMIHKVDNVITVTDVVYSGEVVIYNGNQSFTVLEDTPIYHKIACCPIKKGEEVIKYGEIVGIATENISAGAWVHVHNLKSVSLFKESEK